MERRGLTRSLQKKRSPLLTMSSASSSGSSRRPSSSRPPPGLATLPCSARWLAARRA